MCVVLPLLPESHFLARLPEFCIDNFVGTTASGVFTLRFVVASLNKRRCCRYLHFAYLI
jgi:hypothetical protein